jgi:predicted DNA-binding transcriptional regulator YafY
VDDIASLTGMNKRTVYRDLKALEDELAVPIFQASRGRYGIEKKYFLPPLQLTVPEGVVLFLASRLIAQWSDESDQAVIAPSPRSPPSCPRPSPAT